jgi:hypothetical protein
MKYDVIDIEFKFENIDKYNSVKLILFYFKVILSNIANDIENNIMIFVSSSEMIEEIINYFIETYNYDYYGKFTLLKVYGKAFQFNILTKNEPFNEINIVFEKYKNNIFIRNLWEDMDSERAGIIIYDKDGNINNFNWVQDAGYNVYTKNENPLFYDGEGSALYSEGVDDEDEGSALYAEGVDEDDEDGVENIIMSVCPTCDDSNDK